MGKLKEMWLGGFPTESSKTDTWFEVTQSAIGSFDTSNRQPRSLA